MAKASEQIIDEILILDCRAGTAKAMEVLISRRHRRLWQHAYRHRLVGNTDAAWDVTQQSWLTIIKGLSTPRIAAPQSGTTPLPHSVLPSCRPSSIKTLSLCADH